MDTERAYLGPRCFPFVYEESKQEGGLRQRQVVKALEGGSHIQEPSVVTAAEETFRFREYRVAKFAHQVTCHGVMYTMSFGQTNLLTTHQREVNKSSQVP